MCIMNTHKQTCIFGPLVLYWYNYNSSLNVVSRREIQGNEGRLVRLVI